MEETLPIELTQPEASLSTEEESTPISEEPSSESEPNAEEATSSEEEVSLLKAEIERLRASISRQEEVQKRVMREMEEFSGLFPAVSIREVPESVWQDVGLGIPLSAAYALYERKNRMEKIRAEEVNRQNAERSAGRAGLHTGNEYYSPDEVRSMSSAEIRANLGKIRESMKKWR